MLVAGSITGVEVTPTSGARSAQLISPGFHGSPRLWVHSCAPLAGLRPYSSFASVATNSVPSSRSGCAYTCPFTGVDQSRPNVPPLTSSGVIDGSFGYQPVRRSPPEFVSSEPGASEASACPAAPSSISVNSMHSSDTARILRIKNPLHGGLIQRPLNARIAQGYPS